MRAFLSADADFETSGMVDPVYSRLPEVQRAMSFATDWARHLPADVLDEIGRLGAQFELRPLLAQARRAHGLASGSPESLREALALLEEMRALPEIGRVHVELGRLVGDEAMVEGGRREFPSVGDLGQLDRYGLTVG